MELKVLTDIRDTMDFNLVQLGPVSSPDSGAQISVMLDVMAIIGQARLRLKPTESFVPTSLKFALVRLLPATEATATILETTASRSAALANSAIMEVR